MFTWMNNLFKEKKSNNSIDIENLTSDQMVQVGAQALRKYLNLMSGKSSDGSDFIEMDIFEARVVLESVANHILHNSLQKKTTSTTTKIIDEFGNYREDIPINHPTKRGYRYVHTSKAGMRIYFNGDNGSVCSQPSNPDDYRKRRKEFSDQLQAHLKKTGGRLF